MQQRTKTITQIGIWVSLVAAIVITITGFAIFASNSGTYLETHEEEQAREYRAKIGLALFVTGAFTTGIFGLAAKISLEYKSEVAVNVAMTQPIRVVDKNLP